jgi:hypothetical protein
MKMHVIAGGYEDEEDQQAVPLYPARSFHACLENVLVSAKKGCHSHLPSKENSYCRKHRICHHKDLTSNNNCLELMLFGFA